MLIMRSSTSLIAAGMLFAASTVTAEFGADTVQGCYKNLDNYVFNSSFIYNTDGYCQKQCAPLGNSAMATTKGSDCWCGNSIPSDADKVDDSFCNVPCTGFGAKNCGGAKYWTVYISGLVAAELVPTAEGSSATSASSNVNSPSATKTSAPSVVTVGGQTVVVTAGSSTSNTASASAEKKSSGPNKAAIAAGVVVGIVAIASIAGGVFLFIRNRKRREVEEEYRRNAAVSSFIANGGKPPGSSAGDSFNDTRLDPSVAQRRMSDGSIADNQDYSRRILKVTNA